MAQPMNLTMCSCERDLRFFSSISLFLFNSNCTDSFKGRAATYTHGKHTKSYIHRYNTTPIQNAIQTYLYSGITSLNSPILFLLLFRLTHTVLILDLLPLRTDLCLFYRAYTLYFLYLGKTYLGSGLAKGENALLSKAKREEAASFLSLPPPPAPPPEEDEEEPRGPWWWLILRTWTQTIHNTSSTGHHFVQTIRPNW